MKNVLIIFSIVAASLLSGCSGQKYFNVDTDENVYDYYQGRKIVTKSADGIDISVNYEYRDENNFVYYVYAVNNSDEFISLRPDNIMSGQSAESAEQFIVLPLDPEREIDRIERNQQDLEESHQTNVGMNCLFATIDVVADLADGDGEEAAESAGDWAGEMEYEQDSYEFESVQLTERRMFWENEALRITTLYPGEEIGGLIYFPIVPDTKRIKIIIKVDGNEFQYKFLQITDDE